MWDGVIVDDVAAAEDCNNPILCEVGDDDMHSWNSLPASNGEHG